MCPEIITRSVTCSLPDMIFIFVFFDASSATEIYPLSLHDALPIFTPLAVSVPDGTAKLPTVTGPLVVNDVWTVIERSEEHTSELQSREKDVCRLLPQIMYAPAARV